MSFHPGVLSVAVLLTGIVTPTVRAWDYEGHRVVNELALLSLPPTFPEFVRSTQAQERILFLSGEPDRWRNTHDQPFKHNNAPDHYLDIEDLAPLKLRPDSLPHFRYELAAKIALARAADPKRFPAAATTNDLDHTRWLVGFLPHTIAEQYARLKSAFSSLKAYQEAGTPEEIANAQASVIYYMGVLGHFVGDASQPLHTTLHFNGWVGRNPQGYTTNRGVHALVDGGFFARNGAPAASELKDRLRPAALLWKDDPSRERPDVFPEAMELILRSHKLVEPLYQLEKQGALIGDGPRSREGRDFLLTQILAGGQALGDLWLTAWEQAPPDTYLRTQLQRRKNGNGGARGPRPDTNSAPPAPSPAVPKP